MLYKIEPTKLLITSIVQDARMRNHAPFHWDFALLSNCWAIVAAIKLVTNYLVPRQTARVGTLVPRRIQKRLSVSLFVSV